MRKTIFPPLPSSAAEVTRTFWITDVPRIAEHLDPAGSIPTQAGSAIRKLRQAMIERGFRRLTAYCTRYVLRVRTALSKELNKSGPGFRPAAVRS
jgi:hypothetical protein